jgi:hypothetical protein
MANLKVKDHDAATKYLSASGAGTDGDPHITQHLETNSAAIKAAVEAIQTAVEILDNVVSGSEAQVDVVAALPAGANAIGKLAANSGVDIGDVDVTSMPANTIDTGTVTAAAGTVVATLPGGAASVGLQITGTWVGQLEFEASTDGTNYQSIEASNGTATVNATTGNDIYILPGAGYAKVRVRASAWTSGTANITFLSSVGAAAAILTGALPAGANAIGKLAANSGVDIGDVDVTSLPVGNTNMAASTPVTIASDDTLITALKTALELLDNAISGSEMQVDVVAALPAGANAIGKLAANSGVDIGDVDVTSITGVTMSNAGMQVTGDEAHDAADAGNPQKIGGRAQAPTAALEEVADDDRVDAAFDRQGRLAVWMGYPVQSADINDASSGDNTIVAAAGAGLTIAVLGYHLVSDGTVDVRWEDGAGGTAFTGQMPFQAREGISAGYGFQPMWVGSANTLLNLELSAAINVHGQVSYVVMTD